MTAKHRYRLFSEIFQNFIKESIPGIEDCSYCPFRWECFRPFYLLESGEVKPFDREPIVDYWCVWPSCPKDYLDHKYLYGSERVSIVELLRWHMELGTHKRPELREGLSQLFRLYSIMEDKPRLLREHISAMKMKRDSEHRRNRGNT